MNERPLPAILSGMHYDVDKRAEEEALLRLCAERPLCEAQWRQARTAFFMAGLAMMVAQLGKYAA